MIDAAVDHLGDGMATGVAEYRERLAGAPVELDVTDRPTVNVVQKESWVELRLRYLVHPRRGTRARNALYRKILGRFDDEPDRVAFPVGRNRQPGGLPPPEGLCGRRAGWVDMYTDPQPLAPLARSLRAGDRRPTALVDDLCDRLDAVDDDVSAFLPEPGRRDRLIREATALDARHDDPASRPSLFGVPVGIKDIFHVDGFLTAAGSSIPPAAITGAESTAVTRLRDAGALHVGKAHTTEFAYFHPPSTCNPNDLGHTPGGSSSGSAAAVAAGMCPLALGSQTIGSVIRPAAFCGVVGYKPSYGRIPLDGVVPFAPSVDHVGTFTADVAGAARAAAVLCDGWEPVAPDDPPVVGVVEGPYVEQATAAGRAGVEAGADALDDAGYEVRRVPMLDDIEVINGSHGALAAAEFALTHAEWYAAYGDDYAPETVELIEDGRDVGVDELSAARAARLDLRDRVGERAREAGVDLLVSPGAPGPAPEGLDDTGDPVMNVPWTNAGVPALNVPCGRVGALPLGLQVVAPFGDDESLLAWGVDVAAAVADVGDVSARDGVV
jgi:Asp-tRNA(Asn)/Glu-tRNA(Gln) amidotransferase A subunit family amidase